MDQIGCPVFISDEDGRVEYCNAMVAELVRRDRSDIEGRPCWELLRLRSPDGKLLCRPRCAVQIQARKGETRRVASARFSLNGDPPTPVDLMTTAISPPRGRRCAILHVLKPGVETACQESREVVCRREPGPLETLTPRQREVLGHLANGLGTDAVAEALFVSPATVRNHIRAILGKLNVHSRLQAILARSRYDRRLGSGGLRRPFPTDGTSPQGPVTPPSGASPAARPHGIALDLLDVHGRLGELHLEGFERLDDDPRDRKVVYCATESSHRITRASGASK